MVEKDKNLRRGVTEAMAIEFEQHPFWDYALDVYSRDGVSPALITFQDRHDLDVNILLLCLWVSHSGYGELDDTEFKYALGVSARWNPDIVCAIRAVRIRLREGVDLVPKELSDAVRQEILKVEIDCEHIEQLALAAGLKQRENNGATVEQRLGDCGRNIRSYFDRKGCAPDENDRKELFTIFSAAFGDVDTNEIRSLCDEMFA